MGRSGGGGAGVGVPRTAVPSTGPLCRLCLPAAGVATDWTIAGTGDFDGDSKVDILWRHASSAVGLWLIDGTTVMTATVIATVPTDWTIAGVGNFNGDGKAAIVWQRTSVGVFLWLLNGMAVASAGFAGSVTADWAIQ